MTRSDITDQLRDLGIYADYYYRLELKPLAQVMDIGEKLLCVLTGLHDGRRELLAITDYRLLIIASGALSQGAVTVIPKQKVTASRFDRRFLRSSASFTAEGVTYTFKNTQAARKSLFERAMAYPIKEFDA